MHLAVDLVVSEAGLLHRQPGVDAGQSLPDRPLAVGLAHGPEREAQRLSGLAVGGQIESCRGGLADAGGGVDTERLVQFRFLKGRLRQTLELRARGPHRQGPVEPVDAPADHRPDQNVVERAELGEPLVEAVPIDRAHQGWLGLDPEFVQEREQERGLPLAVAEAPRPGRVRVGRDVAAQVHAEEEVAGLLLHQVQGRRRPGLRVGGGGADPGDLGFQGRGLAEPGGLAIKRIHQLRDGGPVRKLRHLHRRRATEARRRVLGRRRRLEVRTVEHDLGPDHGLGDLRGAERLRGAPPDRLGGRPDLPVVDPADRGGRGDRGHPFGAALVHGILAFDRHDQVEGVAHPQVLGLNRGREPAVERRPFEVLLAPEHQQLATLGEHVDRVAVADDRDPMHGHRLRFRVPADAGRAHGGEPLRRQHLRGVVDVGLVALRSIEGLPLRQQDLDRGARCRLCVLRNLHRDDPRRRRPVMQLSVGPGRSGPHRYRYG